MCDEIVLTKIAKLANGTHISSVSNDSTFVHKNKKWILLEGFKDDAKNIFQIIKLCEIHNSKAIAFVSTDDEQHLVILYRNYVRVTSHGYFIDQLFAKVFSNFKESPSALIIEDKVLNTYVTTKLFETLQLKHDESMKDLPNEVHHRLSLPAKFLPTLCEFQKKSILWLLKREIHKESFPAFFEKLVSKDEETIVYKHLYSRYIQTQPPEEIILPPGGILADEMGLGKTVEMLALILLNTRLNVQLKPALEEFFFTVIAKRKRVEKTVFCICNSKSAKMIIQCANCSLWQHQKCVAFYDSEMNNNTDEILMSQLLAACDTRIWFVRN